MLLPRQAFGLCAVNNFIFVGGGVVGEDQYTSTCDRYDVLTDKWKKLDCCNVPARMYAQTFLAIRSRFIYSFGYSSPYKLKFEKKEHEVILKLDTLNIQAGWSYIRVSCSFAPIGCQYGILPLTNIRGWRGNDTSTLIIFGGLNEDAEPQKKTVLIELDNNNFEKTALFELKPRV